MSVVLLMEVASASWAEPAIGQDVLDKKVTVVSEQKKVKTILNEISKQADVKFIYLTQNMPNKKVFIVAENKALGIVLHQLLQPLNMVFETDGDHIILKRGEMSADELAAGKGSEESNRAEANLKLVTGHVIDSVTGRPLPGVTIQLKGSTLGTTTDDQGNFSINAPDQAVLIVSYLGYDKLEVPVDGQSALNIMLSPSNKGLNEVVVVGYGTQKKKDLTGAISTLRSEDIVRANPINPYQALQGQVAGVNIAKTSSLPGKSYNIDIRGLGSINYNNAPLIVIDGIMGGDLNSINPGDIASMDILKDASATAIYGSRGANGVVIITTKKGTSGRARVNYDGYVGVKVPSHLPEMMNAQEYYKAFHDDIVESGGSAGKFTTAEMANVDGGKSTDWVDLVTRPALQTSHVLAVSGGTNNINYYFSGGYLDEEGNTMGENYKRYNIKGSLDAKLNKVVNVGFNAYYTYSVQNEGSFETLRSAFRARPTGTVYYDDLANPAESSDIDFNGYAVWMGINDHQVISPLVEAYPGNSIEEINVSNFLSSGYVELTPLKGLSIKSSLSTLVYGSRTGDYRGTFSKSGAASKKPTAAYNTANNTSYTLDNLITYQFNVDQHHFTVTALQSAFKARNEKSSISVKDLPYNSDWYNLGTAGTITGVGSDLAQRTLLSYMGRLNYSFKDKYLLTLTGRWDGASVLAAGHQWGFFPSAAFAWRAVDESFIRDMHLFSDLKLRLSYGVVGNDVVPPYGTQANLVNTNYDFGGVAAYGFAPDVIANRFLGWEKSKEIDLGLNIGFLQNRISAEIDLYKRNTVNLILEEQLPASTGFNSVTTNIGEVMNKGLEVTLNTVNVQTPDFTWRTNISFSTNHNEIVQLYGGDVKEDIGNGLFVGQSLKSNYNYKFAGIWQLADSAEAKAYGVAPGQVKVVDVNNSGSITSDSDRVILGSQLPKWMGGITNTFTYKNWDLSFMIYTRQGVQYNNAMESGTMGQITKIRYNVLKLNYWTPSNPTNDYYGLKTAGPWESAIYYQDASYWRVSDITLGFRLPKTLLDRWHIGNFRVYGQVNNPFVFTNFVSFDPEYNSSGGYIDDVPSTTYTFGVNVSF